MVTIFGTCFSTTRELTFATITETPRLLEFEFALSPDLGRKLSRVGLILGQRYGKRVTLEETLEAMSEIFLERLDPERKVKKEMAKPRTAVGGPEKKSRLASVPSALKIQALRRDRNQCTFISGLGAPCCRKKHIQVVPGPSLKHSVVALGDLCTLCPQHRTR